MHASDFPPNRSRWMRKGRTCMAARDWPGAIRAYGQGLIEQPLLGMHYAANLERARRHYRQERHPINQQGPAHNQVVVAAAELSHNAAGRAFTLAQLYQHLGHPVSLLGSHFPQWGRELWEPIRTAVKNAQLPVHSFVAEHESRYVEQAFALVLQHPADLVHLSKPRLPAVVIGLLYKLLWGAAVLVDIDDEELCFVGERKPITLDGLKRLCHGLPEPRELMGPLWTRLAVDLAQRFDGITVANEPLQERYGGTVIPHTRDPERLRPATADEKREARQRFGVPQEAKVVLFFGTPRRHKGLLKLAEAVAELPENLQALLVMAGAFAPDDAGFQQELQARLPAQRLLLMGNQPFEQTAQVLALADLVVLLSEGEVAAFQIPAKLSDALAMGLPVFTSKTPPLMTMVEQGWVRAIGTEKLARQISEFLSDELALQTQAEQARIGFEQTLTIPLVAEHLHETARLAQMYIKPADGRMINALESLHHRISSPLMAYRYRQWDKRRIDWRALQQRERDPELVSIVVPDYGDSAQLDSCLESVRMATNDWRWELIVVMNDDATDNRRVLERHSHADNRIRAVWPGENVQFALACNLGFASSKGDRIVFLNNDCRVQEDWIDALMQPLADEKIAGVQARLVKPDGTIQCLGVTFSNHKKLGRQLFSGLDGTLPYCNEAYALPAISGSCMAIRATDYLKANGFNPVYINSQEDIDLCIRLLKTTAREAFLCTPETMAIHSESIAPGRFRHCRWSQSIFRRIHKDYVYPKLSLADTKSSTRKIQCQPRGIQKKRPTIAIVVHIFYPEIWKEIKYRLQKLKIEFDLFVTGCEDTIKKLDSELQDFPRTRVYSFPNKGMDIVPFLKLAPLLIELGYEITCKLHTKKGHGRQGAAWRNTLLDSLIGDHTLTNRIVEKFKEDKEIVLAGPRELFFSAKKLMYNNQRTVENIYSSLGTLQQSIPDDWGFFAGSMFWCRTCILHDLSKYIISRKECELSSQESQISNSDGELEHALERLIGLSAKKGMIALISTTHEETRSKNTIQHEISVYNEVAIAKEYRQSHVSEALEIILKRN